MLEADPDPLTTHDPIGVTRAVDESFTCFIHERKINPDLFSTNSQSEAFSLLLPFMPQARQHHQPR